MNLMFPNNKGNNHYYTSFLKILDSLTSKEITIKVIYICFELIIFFFKLLYYFKY